MKRYSTIHEALNKKIEIYSELEPGKSYSVEGTPHKFIGQEDNNFIFQADGSDDTTSFPKDELENYMTNGEVLVMTTEYGETVPDFPNLDKFTRNTFMVPTADIWSGSGLSTNGGNGLSSTDLYTLEQLIRDKDLNEMPLPDEGLYEELLNDQRWSILKKYLKTIEPDIELPEELG